MALVVLLRGVNVGGHRAFRPSALARELRHLDVVNIGAAGTFVVHQPMAQARLRAEFARRLPFETDIVICAGRDVRALMSTEMPAAGRNVVRFVSVMSRLPRAMPRLPITLPPDGPWLLSVHARHGRFVVGRYRRHMRVIGYLGRLDRLVGAPVTTRNWSTMTAIARVLREGVAPGAV